MLELEAFAEAVSKPGERVRYLTLDPERRKVPDGYATLAEAITSGRSFMVLLDPDVFVIDADTAEAALQAERIAETIHEDGYTPVLVNSGRTAGLHLFARVGNAKRLELEALCDDLPGVDCRKGDRWIRSPLAPHPAGLPVSLRTPQTAAEAIEALTPPSLPLDLPKPFFDRLEGRTWTRKHDGTPDRSASLQAAALAGIGFGLTPGQVATFLLDRRYLLARAIADKYRRHRKPVSHYVWESINKALRRAVVRDADSFDAIRDRADAIEALNRAEAMALDDSRWTGATSGTSRAALAALCAIGRERGCWTFPRSLAALAVDAGMSKNALRGALDRLEATGLIAREVPARKTGREGQLLATVWTLVLDPSRWTSITVDRSPGVSPWSFTVPDTIDRQGLTPPLDSVSIPGGSVLADVGHDAYRSRALTRRGREILRALAPDGAELTAREIAGRIGCAPRTARRHLAFLRDAGFVTDTGEGWMFATALEALDTDLDTAARIFGTAGRRDAERERVESERRAFLEYLQRQTIDTVANTGPLPHPPLCDDSAPPPEEDIGKLVLIPSARTVGFDPDGEARDGKPKRVNAHAAEIA